jgi:hypothetical protein
MRYSKKVVVHKLTGSAIITLFKDYIINQEEEGR